MKISANPGFHALERTSRSAEDLGSGAGPGGSSPLATGASAAVGDTFQSNPALHSFVEKYSAAQAKVERHQQQSAFLKAVLADLQKGSAAEPLATVLEQASKAKWNLDPEFAAVVRRTAETGRDDATSGLDQLLGRERYAAKRAGSEAENLAAKQTADQLGQQPRLPALNFAFLAGPAPLSAAQLLG